MIAGTNYYLTQTNVPRLRTLWCRNSSSNSSCSSCASHIVSLVSGTTTKIITGSGRNGGSKSVGIGSCKVRHFSYLSQLKPQHHPQQQQKYLPYILPPSYHHQCIQRRCMARNRSKRRSSLIFLEDHALSPRRYPTTTTNTTTTSTNNNPSSIIYDPNIRHHRQHQSKIRLPIREQEMMETEQLFQEINAIVPETSLLFQHHLHYCIKQHLWYRATPILNEKDDDDEDNNNNKDDYDNDHQQRLEKPENSSLRLLPKYYKIDIGLTVRSLESIGDVLLLTLFNNSQKENGPRLPDLNSRRDHLDPYKKKMKTSLPFEEGELLFAIVWEGVEEDKNDHEFYLVTGRNIWRSPIKGIAILNMEYIHRNWTTDPPTIDTVLLSIVCTREDYYSKISEMYDGPLIVPDVENSTSGPNRQKKRIDKFRTMEMDNDALEQHCHPWVSPDDYHSYVEANPP